MGLFWRWRVEIGERVRVCVRWREIGADVGGKSEGNEGRMDKSFWAEHKLNVILDPLILCCVL